jgi:acetyltransferase-like isoleucine patch superfamily enzyme
MFKIHPTADVQTIFIGEGTVIWQFAIVLPDAKIGKNCNINSHTFIENKVILGDRVTIKSGVYLWDGITVGDDVFIGPNATFVNDQYPRSKKYLVNHLGANVEKGASIGANATILSNLTIGQYSMVGAGAVITKNVPPFTLWIGNPAKQIGYITSDGITLDIDLIDKKTGDRYYFENQNLLKFDNNL